VHREQSFEMVRELMRSARALGYVSINADLIYGLPEQTPTSFARTVQQVGELRPDRIALYAYAHLPERFKPQRRIDVAALPGPAIASRCSATRSPASWRAATSTSAWTTSPCPATRSRSRSARAACIRNFQGYSTQPDCDLVGLGVSAIGRVGRRLLPERQDLARVPRERRGRPPAGRARLRARPLTTSCARTPSWP
jgi:oxygen-independent coproporphyrinogen-3 oxidase